MDDLMTGLRELGSAYDGYMRAQSYYEGNPEEFFSNPKLARLLGEMGERYRINMARKVVNVVAKRLRVNSFTVPDNDAATQMIEEIAAANDLELHGPSFARRALEYGDSYAMVWPFYPDGGELPDDDGDELDHELDDQVDDAQARELVEITYNDPLHMRMVYDDEHPNRKAYAIKRWWVSTHDANGAEVTRVRANLYYADRIERYQTKAGTKGKAPEEWETFSEPIENPWGEIPVFHFRTDAPYGRPEHLDAYGPQDALNKLFVTQMATTDSHGFPQRYGLVDPEAVLDQNNDDADWEDDADPVTNETDRADQRGGLRGGPGTMLSLTGIKEAGQWDAADPKVFIDPFSLYVRAMGAVTDTPVHYFDPTGGEKPSGESLRAEDAPLDDKVAERKTWIGATWKELWIFVLKMRGVEVETVEINWRPAAVLADSDGWAVVAAKQAAGVPERQTLLEAGYTADQVDEWTNADEEAMTLARQVAVLDQIGAAVQKLGTAIGFGILTAESANQVLSRVLGLVAPDVDISGDPAAQEAKKAAEQEAQQSAAVDLIKAKGEPGGQGVPAKKAAPAMNGGKAK